MIGVDSDQDGLLPGKILTSAMKRVDIGLLRLSERIAAGEDCRTRHRYAGAWDGLTRRIVEGRIVVPTTLEQLATWNP